MGHRGFRGGDSSPGHADRRGPSDIRRARRGIGRGFGNDLDAGSGFGRSTGTVAKLHPHSARRLVTDLDQCPDSESADSNWPADHCVVSVRGSDPHRYRRSHRLRFCQPVHRTILAWVDRPDAACHSDGRTGPPAERNTAEWSIGCCFTFNG